jgi:signal transduction histidine kinase
MQTRAVKTRIEPGILPLFRSFALLQLGLTVWNLLRGARLVGRLPLAERLPRLNVLLLGKAGSAPVYFLWTMLLILLLLFLSLPQFKRWFGRAYLPTALAAQVIILCAGYELVALARSTGVVNADFGARTWQLFIFLLIPVILASWQYPLRKVFWFILLISTVDFLFSAPLALRTDLRLAGAAVIIAIRGILYLLVAYAVTRLMHEQREMRAALESANQQLRQYADALDTLATARERNRLARELHDTLAHTLSALVIQLEAINVIFEQEPQKARQQLADSAAQARSGLNEARRAIKALRAAPLEELGLLLALRQLAGDAAERGGFKVGVHLPESLPRLLPEVENDLYRAAVEGFENIVRHAAASQADLRLEQHGSFLELTLSDNGRGFDPAAVEKSGHFGLVGLRERAAQHGAGLEITSQPGKGAQIRFRVEIGK